MGIDHNRTSNGASASPKTSASSNTSSSSKTPSSSTTTESSKWSVKRVIAWAAIVALLVMYAAAILSALFGGPNLFRLCFGLTIVIPLFAWVLIWAYGVMTTRHTIASMDIMNSNEQARKEMEEGVKREFGEKDERED